MPFGSCIFTVLTKLQYQCTSAAAKAPAKEQRGCRIEQTSYIGHEITLTVMHRSKKKKKKKKKKKFVRDPKLKI